MGRDLFRAGFGVAFVALAAAGSLVAARPPSTRLGYGEPSALRIRKAVASRLSILVNLSVTYSRDVDFTPQNFAGMLRRIERTSAARAAHPGEPKISGYPILREGRWSYLCRFSFLDGRARYERRRARATEDAGRRGHAEGGLLAEVQSFTPQRVETLSWRVRSQKPIGDIKSRSPLPLSNIDVALGLRSWVTHNRWLTKADIMKMTVRRAGADTFVLSRERRGREQRWTFRMTPTIALLRFSDSSPAPAKGQYVVVCSRFHTVGGVALPGRVSARILPLGPSGPPSVRTLLTRLHYSIGSKLNSPSDYDLTFPKGAGVIDTRTGQTFLVESRPRKLSDAAIYAIMHHVDRQGQGPPSRGVNNAKSVARRVVPPISGPKLNSPAAVAKPLVQPNARRLLWWAIFFAALGGMTVLLFVMVRRGGTWKKP